MKENLLDMRLHEVEDIPGKMVVINGAEYTFLDMIDEGGESFVYPLRNCVSGISRFVAKVYKWKPDSLEYESRKDVAKITFEADMFNKLTPDSVLTIIRTEVYEIPGAMIRVEESFRAPGPEYYPDLMDKAEEFLKRELYKEALVIYDNILQLNPNHVFAMVNKAACLIATNNASEAFILMKFALSIEPNYRGIYHQAAYALLALGYPGGAIDFLDKTLKRCIWDADTWLLKTRIATDYSLVDVIENMEQLIKSLLPDRDTIKPYITQLQAHLEKAKLNQSYADDAMELQLKGQWEAALALWEKRLDSFDSDLVARLNRNICKFNIEVTNELANECLYLLTLLPNWATNHCALLALLCNYRVGNLDVVKRIAVFLSPITDPWEIPCVPAVITDGNIFESASVKEILTALIETNATASFMENEKLSIESLIRLYEEVQIIRSQES